MRIKGINKPKYTNSTPKGGVFDRLKNFNFKDLINKFSKGGSNKKRKPSKPSSSYGAPSKVRTTPTSSAIGYSYTTPKFPFDVYGPPTKPARPGNGLQNILKDGNFLDKLKKLNFGGMNDVFKSTVSEASNSLPELSRAITIMSFVAFSVFVANLGVNAVTNVSLVQSHSLR